MTNVSPKNANELIRVATVDEVDVLMDLRLAMFAAIGFEKQALDQAIIPMRNYFEQHMRTGAFRVWVAERQGEPVASIGLIIHSIPPSPRNLAGKEAYVMNLVTLPKYRRQGIARQLLLHVLDVVRSEGIPIASLHATPAGRLLYEQLGFTISDDAPEMKLPL